MTGRLDLQEVVCATCAGSTRDPKKRTRQGPACGGTGVGYVCRSCGGAMPCAGTTGTQLDQSYCTLRKE